MKPIMCTLVLLTGLFSTNAQEIGIRFGHMVNNTIAVDGVFQLDDKRIHGNVSFGDDLGIDAIWNFMYKPIEQNLNWYVGIGPSLVLGDDFYLGASGEVGLEYVFSKAPIAIGLDYRPTFWVIEDTDFDFGGFGFNVRYRF